MQLQAILDVNGNPQGTGILTSLMIWKVLPPTTLFCSFRRANILIGAIRRNNAEGAIERNKFSKRNVKSKERKHGSTWGPK
jgi:hypothetical protein